MEKFVLKSKEVWILGLAIIFVLGEAAGVLVFDNMIETIKDAYIALAPVAALLMRVFYTNSKLRLTP